MPINRRCLHYTFSVAAALLALSACNPDRSESVAPVHPTAPPAPASGQTVVCLFSDARMPFQRAQAEFLNLLDAQDPERQLVMHDAQGQFDRQLTQIKTLANSPPTVLLLQPVDVAATATLIATLNTAKTRILLLDPPGVPEPSPSVESTIACDPLEIGRAAANVTIEALTRRAHAQGESAPQGRILEIRGSDASPWCSRVHEGFVGGLTTQTGIVLVHDAPADWTPAKAKSRYTEAIRLQKAIDVVFAHDDFIAQAIHLAATEAGTRDDTLIIGVNGFAGPEGGLKMMKRNELDATIQRPFLVDHAWQLIRQAPDPGHPAETFVKPRTIVPGNLDNPVPDQTPQAR